MLIPPFDLALRQQGGFCWNGDAKPHLYFPFVLQTCVDSESLWYASPVVRVDALGFDADLSLEPA